MNDASIDKVTFVVVFNVVFKGIAIIGLITLRMACFSAFEKNFVIEPSIKTEEKMVSHNNLFWKTVKPSVSSDTTISRGKIYSKEETCRTMATHNLQSRNSSLDELLAKDSPVSIPKQNLKSC